MQNNQNNPAYTTYDYVMKCLFERLGGRSCLWLYCSFMQAVLPHVFLTSFNAMYTCAEFLPRYLSCLWSIDTEFKLQAIRYRLYMCTYYIYCLHTMSIHYLWNSPGYMAPRTIHAKWQQRNHDMIKKLYSTWCVLVLCNIIWHASGQLMANNMKHTGLHGHFVEADWQEFKRYYQYNYIRGNGGKCGTCLKRGILNGHLDLEWTLPVPESSSQYGCPRPRSQYLLPFIHAMFIFPPTSPNINFKVHW